MSGASSDPTVSLHGIVFHLWGLAVVTGVLICWALLLLRTGRLGYSRRGVFAWLVLSLPVGALAGRGTANAVEWLVAGGSDASRMSVLGSIGGCLAFGVLFIRRVLGVEPAPLFDAAAFSYPLALAVGRVGCMLHGCCLGRAASRLAPDLVTRPPPAAVGLHPGARIWNLPLLLGGNALLALCATEWIYRRRERWRLRPGSVLCLSLVIEGTGRFFLEFLRDERLVPPLGLNPWQTLGLLLTAGCAAELLRRNRRRSSARV